MELMTSVPYVLEVLERHIGSLPVVEAALGFLRNVATNGANQRGLLHVVPAVGRALTQAPGANSAIAAEHGLACLLNIAVDDGGCEWVPGVEGGGGLRMFEGSWLGDGDGGGGGGGSGHCCGGGGGGDVGVGVGGGGERLHRVFCVWAFLCACVDYRMEHLRSAVL